ncbi:uncharacterized protein LY79DRAFT_693990 [Colletotrichum navitas]|uniref:Uncharacterized protein n=1 Tax=Colletotrichum navitas TaxID=681940 RepID=A0AAD8PRL8_9PEZI|nr:uncharacterized protein LY79DRAFT_693990 [Colletotrichum navitas]KAK1579451.1 hypothetical protein LY79DRAFT_693990 [Colletotrichum navitas]
MHGHGPRRWDHTLDVTSSTSTICHLTLSRPITLSAVNSRLHQHTTITPSSPFLCLSNCQVSLHRGAKILVNLGIIPLALARVAPTLPSSPRNLTKKTSMPPDEQIARE